MRAKPAEQGIPRSELVQHPVRKVFGGAQEGAGRPSKYTPALGEEICTWIADGNLLMDWCAVKGRPTRVTVFNWVNKYPEFCASYEHAREMAADAMDEKMMHVADTATIDNANLANVKIKTYQWRAMRMHRRKYAEHTTTDINQTIRNETPLDLSQLPQDVRDALRVSLERQIAREHDEKHTIDGDCTDLSST